MTTDREFIKEVLIGKVNQRVYSNSEIKNLFRDIGLKVSETGIRENLRENEILPANYGIDSSRFGYNKETRFYAENDIWRYLKELENMRKIDLKAIGVHNFKDLLSRKNNLRDHYIKGRVIKKHILDN